MTPRRLVIELNEAGTDYLSHGDLVVDDFTQSWHILRMILEDARAELTRQEIQQEWPDDFTAPKGATRSRSDGAAPEQGCPGPAFQSSLIEESSTSPDVPGQPSPRL